MNALLQKMYAPQWAGGWPVARWLFVIVAVITQFPRHRGIGDVYGVDDMLFSNPPFYLADIWVLSEGAAWGIWGLSFVGLGMLAWGGRLAKPGMVIWLVLSWTLLANEALNIKAYDRVLTWIAFGLLFGPIGERDLQNKARSPFGRWFLILFYCALYGATGWLKLLVETKGWFQGNVLAYHLVHQHFGMQPLGIWLSDKPAIMAVMSWFTLAFEGGFPFLIWWRKTAPWLLLAGLGLHLGIFLTMNVGPFSVVAIVAYPVLLHPEQAQRIHLWWQDRRGGQASNTPSVMQA